MTLVLHEHDAGWNEVSAALAGLDVLDMVDTSFTQREIAAATWSFMSPTWHHGYPQPEDDSRYLEVTYDLRGYCANCGAGAVQRAPFRMKREPRWGSNQILQLNWIFGEYFVTPDLYDRVFAPRGVLSRPVENTVGGTLETVVQLVVDQAVPLVTDGLIAETCETCNTQKYRYVRRGRWPPPAVNPSGPMFRTTQYFGSGGSAAQPVVVHQSLAAALRARKVKGVSFKPLMGELQA